MGKSGWVPLYNANSSTVNNLKSSSSSSTVNNFNLKRRAAMRATTTPKIMIIILLFFICLLRSRRSWPKRMNQRGLGEWGASARVWEWVWLPQQVLAVVEFKDMWNDLVLGVWFGPPKKNTGWIMDISIRKWELTSLMDFFFFFLYVHLLFNSKWFFFLVL